MVNSIEEMLLRDEGLVTHAYQDHLGFWTIGVGRLIDKRKGGGITKEEALYLLRNDIAKVDSEVSKRLPWANGLDPARRAVINAMAFQMGIAGLMGFSNTLKLVQNKQYSDAAKNMLKSKWARQTPERAARMAKQMETGVWQ